MTASDKIEPKEEMKIALDNRAFEIQLFWQRSNYFLVLMSALGIGAFTIKDHYLAPFVAVFAAACSYLWFKTNLGSKFWQESWEVEVSLLAKEFGVRSFERPIAEVIDQVSTSLNKSRAGEKHSAFRKWIDRLVIEKPSVTYHMIILSLISMMVWFSVAVVLAARLVIGVEPSPTAAGSISQSRTEVVFQPPASGQEAPPLDPQGTGGEDALKGQSRLAPPVSAQQPVAP